MTSRAHVISGILLAVLLGAPVLLNIYFIKPRSAFTPSEPAGTAPARSGNFSGLSTNSLDFIKTGGRNDSDTEGESEKVKRNPFLWPDEIKALTRKRIEEAKTPAAAGRGKKSPRLSMIIVGGNRKLALLDDIFVREGDMVNDYKVLKIGRNQVTLKGAGKDIRLKINPPRGRR